MGRELSTRRHCIIETLASTLNVVCNKKNKRVTKSKKNTPGAPLDRQAVPLRSWRTMAHRPSLLKITRHRVREITRHKREHADEVSLFFGRHIHAEAPLKVKKVSQGRPTKAVFFKKCVGSVERPKRWAFFRRWQTQLHKPPLKVKKVFKNSVSEQIATKNYYNTHIL